MATQTPPDQDPLFEMPAHAGGPVETAALRSIDALRQANGLDENRDALLIAHVISVAAMLDKCSGRIDPKTMTILSRELRSSAAALGLIRPPAPAESGGGGDAFGFLGLADGGAG